MLLHGQVARPLPPSRPSRRSSSPRSVLEAGSRPGVTGNFTRNLLPMTDTNALRAFLRDVRIELESNLDRSATTTPRARGWYAGPHAGSESRAGCNKYVGKADRNARCVSRASLSNSCFSEVWRMEEGGADRLSLLASIRSLAGILMIRRCEKWTRANTATGCIT